MEDQPPETRTLPEEAKGEDRAGGGEGKEEREGGEKWTRFTMGRCTSDRLVPYLYLHLPCFI